MRAVPVVVLLAVVAGLGATAHAQARATGTIRGVVRFEGEPPPRAKVDRSADPKCPQDALAEDVVVTDGKLQDVLVRVTKGPKRALDDQPAPTTRLVITQDGCRYTPRVSGAMRGQQLEIRNGDPLFHNVRGTAGPADDVAFNLPHPAEGKPIVRELDGSADTIALHCDVHPWMAAWVAVLTHPHFAVTGADGAFTLAGLPPGSYVLEAWHPVLGRRTAKVKVPKGKRGARAAIVFSAR